MTTRFEINSIRSGNLMIAGYVPSVSGGDMVDSGFG